MATQTHWSDTDAATQELRSFTTHAQYAAMCLRDSMAKIQNKIPALPNDASGEKLAPIKDTLFEGEDKGLSFKVGIIGAGIAGLFTAYLFDYLRKEYNLPVEYEILEANGEARVGGRLYTYEFPNNRGHDYYDVGAMRFPENAVMKRTFDLFENLEMKRSLPPNKPEKGDLIQYWLNGRNTPLLYNGVQVVKNPINKDDPPATAANFNITGLPLQVLAMSPSNEISRVVEPFVSKYQDSPKEFWKSLMESGDRYSVRQYLSQVKNFEYSTIEWFETANFGNRWYDQAFSEMVLEELDFNSKNKGWWCVEGGAQTIARKVRDRLQHPENLHFNKSVSGLSYIRDDQNKPRHVLVTVRDESEPRKYDAVFNSAPLGAMQHMDLEGLNLEWGVKQAIRSLGYGASCKVGIKFTRLWWLEPPFNITRGGVSRTDLPLRCCVYPSYNMYDKPADGGVLLVSYTWSQEATRIGALIKEGDNPEKERQLKELLLHDLARLHTGDEPGYRALRKTLEELYESHYAHSWDAHETSVGAFAYFGPGQYQNMYPSLSNNDGKHIIIGEAASAHHAWVVGALESAVRGVYQFAYRHSKFCKPASDVAIAYANNEIPGPFGPLPYEYDRTKEVKNLGAPDKVLEGVKAEQSLPIGEIARMGVWFEKLRQVQEKDTLDALEVKADQIRPILQAVVAQG